MSADKFLNSSTLGNAGSFPFEKLTPWTELAPDRVEWEQGDREELGRFFNGAFALMRPSRSAFDSFIEAGGDGSAGGEGATHIRTISRQSHRFLMTYDWAGAFAGDRDFDDRGSEFRLPAPNCCFDFYVSGNHVLALISDQAIRADGSLVPFDGEGTDLFFLGIELKSRNWMVIGHGEKRDLNVLDGETRLFAFILKNIKAACISLEAGIAEAEVIRVPYKLNAARARRGKPPISDYHIINLRVRERVKPPDEPENHHRSPRLHFRRGHWRHFVSHKTWIKWTLVGDPDLGFIHKEYRL